MSMNDTPSSRRVHIGFFGCRNAGKSSLINAVTGQDVSVVSETAGTTTDAVSKSMELLPVGPVLLIDTPGFDDEGLLGQKRVERTLKTLARTDAAVLVTASAQGLSDHERTLIGLFTDKGIPYLIARNKCDEHTKMLDGAPGEIYVSARTGENVDLLREALAGLAATKPERPLLSDLVGRHDTVLLVTPIDAAAPKGRLILPQQQALREVLDAGAVAVVAQDGELEAALARLKDAPTLVVTDSQAFMQVARIVPQSVPLTSFSILFARRNGFLDEAVRGAQAIDALKDGDTVLISEGCTHKRQCGDIGTVKLPSWLERHTRKALKFVFSSGGGFPDDLSGYALVVHCGGCMLNGREVLARVQRARAQGVKFTNYGVAIAFMKGVLNRSLKPLCGKY